MADRVHWRAPSLPLASTSYPCRSCGYSNCDCFSGYDSPPSHLEFWSSLAKGHIRHDLDSATRFIRNIDIPLQDFVTASFTVSKDDISSAKSRVWDMIDDLVSNYRRMVQQKVHESKLYPFFQRILVRLAQEFTKDEDLAFVAREVPSGR
ncbi:hypothetical protein PTI98_013519 [Pleurotus ostreatus]|nr:hypothetical protein PTI98_013519 [Pleurotus ostreatus]